MIRYDAFIAYAGPDIEYAKKLDSLLSVIGYSVFMAPHKLSLGTRFPQELIRAQESSLLTLVLISSHSDASYFLQEEILRAIELAKKQRHRVLPIYLSGNQAQNSDVPLTLTQLQSIFLAEEFSLLSVAQKIEATLYSIKRRQEWQHDLDPATIIIVTGCHHRPELYDRPIAYELKEAIDSEMSSRKKTFLGCLVMGDLWFWQRSGITDWPNLISVGSSGVNSLTAHLVPAGVSVKTGGTGEEERWEVVRLSNQWALFGNRAQDTLTAVQWFKSNCLSAYLRDVWSAHHEKDPT